jgi:hypothetical protein
MKKALFLLMLLVTLFGSISCAIAAEGDPPPPNEGTPSTVTDNGSGQDASAIRLPNPLKGVDSVPALIGKVINSVLTVVGSLALVMFIYGGFTWMLSGGNSSSIEKGKNILIWAALGLVVIFISYALVNFVISTATGS